MMNENVYSEFSDVAGSTVQVFAMKLDGDKLVWSIGSKQNGIGVEIGDTTTEAVKSLKQLKKQIDGAIKFMNDKQKEIHDETAK
jgi:prefoldin subunit 5